MPAGTKLHSADPNYISIVNVVIFKYKSESLQIKGPQQNMCECVCMCVCEREREREKEREREREREEERE
jgi:hypothetical protein